MTCGPIRRFVVTVAAAAAVSLLLIYLDAAAQTRPASNGAAASVPTPHTPDGKPDLSGRWGGGGGGAGGAGGVQAIEPNGQVHQFEHYSEVSAALAAGTVSANAKIVGRQPNYRHGNNLYYRSVTLDSRNGRSATRRCTSPKSGNASSIWMRTATRKTPRSRVSRREFRDSVRQCASSRLPRTSCCCTRTGTPGASSPPTDAPTIQSIRRTRRSWAIPLGAGRAIRSSSR